MVYVELLLYDFYVGIYDAGVPNLHKSGTVLGLSGGDA